MDIQGARYQYVQRYNFLLMYLLYVPSQRNSQQKMFNVSLEGFNPAKDFFKDLIVQFRRNSRFRRFQAENISSKDFSQVSGETHFAQIKFWGLRHRTAQMVIQIPYLGLEFGILQKKGTLGTKVEKTTPLSAEKNEHVLRAVRLKTCLDQLGLRRQTQTQSEVV